MIPSCSIYSNHHCVCLHLSFCRLNFYKGVYHSHPQNNHYLKCMFPIWLQWLKQLIQERLLSQVTKDSKNSSGLKHNWIRASSSSQALVISMHRSHSHLLQTALLHGWCGRYGRCTSHTMPPENTICPTVLTQSRASICELL